jgi:hypothetical protein
VASLSLYPKFNETDSESLNNSRNAFEHLTFTRRHKEFDRINFPTLSIVETTDWDHNHCYLGVLQRMRAVSQLDSLATIVKLRELSVPSIERFCDHLLGVHNKNLLKGRIPVSDEISLLSPKLSSDIIRIIAADAANEPALNLANSQLLGTKNFSNAEWSQLSAIHLAIEAFGLEKSAIPTETTIRKGSFSTLDDLGHTIYEDNIIAKDAASIPGFSLLENDITGRSVFVKGKELLVVYTANRLPLEEMLGVDLIYLNEILGNIVMIQYKMLEEEIEDQNYEKTDWIFRLDSQTREEISRMMIPVTGSKPDDYRLNKSPFYFKFIKRRGDSESSYYISLDHFLQLTSSPGSIGKRGGIRISYQALGGNYLRADGMINLIRSGYIGTHRMDYNSLNTIISEVAKGNRGLVFAWQRRRQYL